MIKMMKFVLPWSLLFSFTIVLFRIILDLFLQEPINLVKLSALFSAWAVTGLAVGVFLYKKTCSQ